MQAVGDAAGRARPRRRAARARLRLATPASRSTSTACAGSSPAPGWTSRRCRTPADLPLDEAARTACAARRRRPTPLAQNCSGKHAAMLATCVANGWPTDDLPRRRSTRCSARCARRSRSWPASTSPRPASTAAARRCSRCRLTGLARAFAAIATAAAGTPERRVARRDPGPPGVARRHRPRRHPADRAACPGWSPRTAPRASTPPRCPTAARWRSRSRTAAQRARPPVLVAALRAARRRGRRCSTSWPSRAARRRPAGGLGPGRHLSLAVTMRARRCRTADLGSSR